MMYDALLQDIVDALAGELGVRDFTHLSLEMELFSPRAVQYALSYTRSDGTLEEGDGIDGEFSTQLTRQVLALREASMDEGRGDLNRLTFHLASDGKFHLDLAYGPFGVDAA